MKHQVSVVVLGFNHEFCLCACLASLQQQDYPAIEVIYVDNASADSSCEFVAKTFPTIRIVQNSENFGFAKGNNIGIEQAQGEFVFVLNPDTTLAPDCISRLVEYMSNANDVGICMPKLLHRDRPNIINSVGMTYDRRGHQYHIGDGEVDVGQYPSPMEILLVAGACMFCRKETLEQIGGFDENYFAYYEDTELSLRAWWHGWRCVYVPNAIVFHLRNAAAKNSEQYYQKARYFAHRNQYWPILTHLPLASMLHMAPAILLNETKVLAKDVIRMLKHRKVPIELKARLDGFFRLTSLLEKRKRMRSPKLTPNIKLAELLDK